MKICTKCKIEKPYTEFRKASRYKDGYDYHCKECVSGHKIHKPILEGLKTCTKCKIEKDINEFTNIKHLKHSICRKCKSEYRSLKRKENPEKEKLRKRIQRLKSKYGLTIMDYENMYNNQKGCCKICDTELSLLNVDHCHTTLKVRGLLCSPCNTLLGLAKDNIETLESAIKYLKENNC